MPQRRRRDVRRNVLVFLVSLAFHAGVFLIALNDIQFYPTLPEQPQPPMQAEIVPETIPIIHIPPPPIPKVQQTPTPKPPAPPPTPVQQPQPPKPQQTVAKTQAAAKPSITPTAPIKAAQNPTLTPAPKPNIIPSQLAPPIPSQIEGPPKAVPASSLSHAQVVTVQSQLKNLHKSQNATSALAPSVSIPGATFATPQPSGGQTGQTGPQGTQGLAGGGGGGTLPGGSLGFGKGLRGGALGCMNAAALNLSAAEQQRCDAAYGAETKIAPEMDRIGSAKRAVIEQQAATAEAAEKYRDSVPTGTVDHGPLPGQPRDGHSPTE